MYYTFAAIKLVAIIATTNAIKLITNQKLMASYVLRKIPKDVYDILIDEQKKIKKKKEVKVYSIEMTIYHIIKEHKKCKEATNE